jgi:hypothetical protein
MRYNVTITCPDTIAMVDANGFFKHLICVIQDLELQIADMQYSLVSLQRPDEVGQLQLYHRCSNLPDLDRDPVLCNFLAFNRISIEEWRDNVEQHLNDLDACVNGVEVIATDIL